MRSSQSRFTPLLCLSLSVLAISCGPQTTQSAPELPGEASDTLNMPKGMYITALNTAAGVQGWRFTTYAGPAATLTTYEGEITSINDPLNFTFERLESSDILELVGSGRLHFFSQVSASNDIFAVTYQAPQTLCLNLSNTALPVFVGASKTRRIPPFNIATGAACASSIVPTYSVMGTVSGLSASQALTLQNDASNQVAVTIDGPFVLPAKLPEGASYNVTVAPQPLGQTCTVTNGIGVIASADVTNVTVVCVNNPSTGSLDRIETTGNTLTVFSKEPLKVNSPFFGIEVLKNGVDITDSIVSIASVTDSSWRYTFSNQTLNTPGANISFSIENTALASPGHYVAVREGSQKGNSVQSMRQILADCQAGTGDCSGRAPVPGLVAAVKGISKRYEPRAMETAQGVYDFSEIFNDAAYLASVGMQLHLIFTVKTFGINTLYNGNGANRAFEIRRSASGDSGWDGVRTREIHVYINGVETSAYLLNANRNGIILNTAPPTGTKNVNIVYARDPFPDYVWNLSPPIAGWYAGEGGPNTEAGAGGGSHGFVHAPWRPTCISWMRNFMAAFQTQWTQAIASGAVPARAIEAISIQETSNALSNTDPTYSVAGVRAGLLEYSKSNARAVRRRALHGILLNHITGGNQSGALEGHANDVALWAGRAEGPDLFNDEPSLEGNDKVYQLVHRDLHNKLMTMIWHQNASYSEPNGSTFFTPAQQYAKAKKGVTDTSTASGTRGLEAEYVFWNMTTRAPCPNPNNCSPLNFKDALGVIAANPVIQTSGNDKYLWRGAATSVPIPNQTLTKLNP